MYNDWYALKHPSSEEDEWLVSPKEFFDKNGFIPDSHANLKIFGMDEVSDHTYEPNDKGIRTGKSSRELMRDAGFEILDNPVWYFQRKGYLRNK